MKAVMLTAVLLAAHAAAASDEALFAAVAAFGNAYRDADVERLSEMLTEDYVHTNSSSTPIGRDAWLGWVASRRTAIDQGRLRVTAWDVGRGA